MSFLNLWAMWIAAAVVPALLILYFLKLRRREERVPSTLLWKRAVQDLQVNAPFQRLRKNLLLFLQLLILAAAIFALARPIVESTSAAEGRMVILIDRSASMNTQEDDLTRLELAKEQAVRLVKTLNRRSDSWLSFLQFAGAISKTQAMVIAFSDRAAVLSPFTPNTADLVDIIRRIEPTDGRTNIREALELAEAYMAPPTMTTDKTPISAEQAAKVVLVSDGGLADLDEAVLRAGEIELIKVGQTDDNVGITALRTRRSYDRPEILNVFLQIENFSEQTVTTAISLYIDGELAGARVRDVTLGPAEDARERAGGTPEAAEPVGPPSTQGLSFELVLERAAVVEARLARLDALPVDNRAYAVVPPPRKLRVLVVTPNNFFLDSVLQGLPLAERVFVTPTEYDSAPGDYAQDGQSPYDVVIFDKHRPGPLPIGNYFFLGATPPIEEIELVEPIEEFHALVWWDEAHPVLRHVSLDYVYVGQGARVSYSARGRDTDRGPAWSGAGPLRQGRPALPGAVIRDREQHLVAETQLSGVRV